MSDMNQALCLYVVCDTVVYKADGSSACVSPILMSQETQSKQSNIHVMASVTNQDTRSEL